jgi:hypothetical protein
VKLRRLAKPIPAALFVGLTAMPASAASRAARSPANTAFPASKSGAEKTVTATVKAFEPGQKLVVKTTKGEQKFDLTMVNSTIPDAIAVGDRVELQEGRSRTGRETLTVERAPA